MFIAIVFIAIGIALLLNVLGILGGNFWGFFWAILFLAIGIKLLLKKEGCPMCGMGMWKGGMMHKRMHEKMDGHCCDHDHE